MRSVTPASSRNWVREVRSCTRAQQRHSSERRKTPSHRPELLQTCSTKRARHKPYRIGPGFDPGRRLNEGQPYEGQPYGVAVASEACSEASVTQALRRCSPLIAPVTLSTFPAGQDASCTKAIS
jgi:hypothetical protein